MSTLAIFTMTSAVRKTTEVEVTTASEPLKTVIEYWSQGSLKSIRHYDTAGRSEGVHLGWWPNGQLRFEYTFKNGLLSGEVNEWLEGGNPYRSFHYRAGKEVGCQRMWYEDGTLRANYVVKDGRRFGLMGSKPCKPGEGNT